MPELPEVETIKNALKDNFTHAQIISVEVRKRNLRESIPDDFEQVVAGALITEIYRRAKYAIMQLDNGYSIILHFGMSGKIKIRKDLPSEFEKHDHVIINTSCGYIIYNDARRFGIITYSPTHQLNTHPLFSHMGIDPFDEKLTAAYLLNIFKHKKSAIKIALLDQSIISGIGNIYASEALYDARISPLRPCTQITLHEIERLIQSIRNTLLLAIKAGGSTLRDYRKPDGKLGYFQHQHCVYNKTGEPCPHCTCHIKKSDGIVKIVQGGRSTFYCKHLQK